MNAMSLSYRIIDGPVDLDVTDHVVGTPELTWNAVGGCETARVRVDLPLSTFPTLGRRSRLIVTDHAARGVWDGYCTDPGGVDDDAGEAFDLTADGSMAAGSLRVARLVYADSDYGSWDRARGSVESGQVSHVTDPAEAWVITHPQGYVIGTGDSVGIEYRLLEHSVQGIGRVAFTMVGGADDVGFDVEVTTWADGVLVDTVSTALSDTPAAVDMVAGVDISTGCDVVRVSLVRAGAATNNPTALSTLTITSPIVEGALVDQWGTTVTPGGPVTSAVVVADLVGRGMLGPVDPDAAVIDTSAAVHTQLSWPTGTRGAAALEALRAVDPDMVWMYGVRGPAGYRFEWTRWAPENGLTGDRGVRYDFGDQDTITATGSTELPADRVMVIWTDDDGDEHTLLVEYPGAGDDEYTRDLDPITMGESTELAAGEAGLDALTRSQGTGRTVTVTVSREVLDRDAGLKVEPHELRPGCLARLEATGEILRVQAVTYRGGDAGGTAEVTLGDPSQTLDDRVLAVVRGEVDPKAPLIPLPAGSTPGPTPVAPATSDGEPPSTAPVLTIRENIGSAFFTWEPVENADPVEYRILVGDSPTLTESPTTYAATMSGTFFVARTLPNGTAFDPEATYYGRLIPADPDGDGPASDVVAFTVSPTITHTQITDGAIETPHLAANAVSAAYLIANDAWIDVLRAISFYGETITGPLIQTLATANRGIKLDGSNNRLRGWDGSGNLMFDLNASAGTLTIKGDITSGSTITGALFRTATSGKRIEIATNGSITAYNAAGDSSVIDMSTAGLLVVSADDGAEFSGTVYADGFYTLGDALVFGELTTQNISGGGVGINVDGAILCNDIAVFDLQVSALGGVAASAAITDSTLAGTFAAASINTNGRAVRTTSSVRFKKDVDPVDFDEADVLAMQPVTYRYIDEENYGTTQFVGFIAEQLVECGMGAFVFRDTDGEPEGIHYPQLSAALVDVLHKHRGEIDALTARIEALEA